MVELNVEAAEWARPADGYRWGWPTFATSLRAFIEHGRRNIRRVAEAHDRVRRSRAVTEESIRDTGLGREDILGEPTWQADLPFFMQRNFR